MAKLTAAQSAVNDGAEIFEDLLEACVKMSNKAHSRFNGEAAEHFDELAREIVEEAKSRVAVRVCEELGLRKQSNRVLPKIETEE